MKRIEKILKHPLFLDSLEKNHTAEADRRFCRHNMEHFLSVARLCYILCLEEGYPIQKDVVYAAGLLHDIGKHRQYLEQIPHELASAEIAPVILMDCGYTKEETDTIVSAIRTHRDKSIREEKSLNGYLYRADKASRTCYACKAIADCNWKEGTQNFSVY